MTRIRSNYKRCNISIKLGSIAKQRRNTLDLASNVLLALICFFTGLIYLFVWDWNNSLEYPIAFIWAAICIIVLNLNELRRDEYIPSPIFFVFAIIQFYTVFGPLYVAITGNEPSPRVVLLMYGGQCWQYALAACVTAMLFFWAGYLGSLFVFGNQWIQKSRTVHNSKVGLFEAAISLGILSFICFFVLSRSIFSGYYGQLFVDFEARSVATIWAFSEGLFCIGLAHYLCFYKKKALVRDAAFWLILGYALLVISLGMRQRLIGLLLTIYMVTFSRFTRIKIRLILPVVGSIILINLLAVGLSRFSSKGVIAEIFTGGGIKQLINTGYEDMFDTLLYTACEPTSITARTVAIYGDKGTDYGMFYLLQIQRLLPRELRFMTMPHDNINMDISYKTISWAERNRYTMGGSPVAEVIRSFGRLGIIIFILFGMLFKLIRDGQYCQNPTWGKLCVVWLVPVYAYVSRNATDFVFNIIYAFLFSLLCHYIYCIKYMRKREKDYENNYQQKSLLSR